MLWFVLALVWSKDWIVRVKWWIPLETVEPAVRPSGWVLQLLPRLAGCGFQELLPGIQELETFSSLLSATSWCFFNGNSEFVYKLIYKPGLWAAPGGSCIHCPHSKDVTTIKHSFYFLLFPLKLMWNSNKAYHYSHAWSIWVCFPALSLSRRFSALSLARIAFLLASVWSGRSEGVKMASVTRRGVECVMRPWQWTLGGLFTEALGLSHTGSFDLNYMNFLGLH